MIDVTVTVDSQPITDALQRLGTKVRRAQNNAMTEIKAGVLQDFQRTTATWQHKVEFRAYQSSNGDNLSVRVATEDKIYKFVDAGTRPHIIRPKQPGGRLAFRWGGPGSYRAKTAPGFIASKSGGATGSYVYRSFVHHPGTEARKFSAAIRELWNRNSGAIMQRHIAAQLTTKW